MKLVGFLLLLAVAGTRALVLPKQGVCPYAPPWMFCPPEEHVVAHCDSDDDCPGIAKCCAVGGSNCGGRACTSNLLVRVVRPGSCPAEVAFGEPGWMPVICDMFQCGEDAHCPANQKCCTNACGSTECIQVNWLDNWWVIKPYETCLYKRSPEFYILYYTWVSGTPRSSCPWTW